MHGAGCAYMARASQDRASLPEGSIPIREFSICLVAEHLVSSRSRAVVIIRDSYQIGLFQSLPVARSERRIATADSLINGRRQGIYSPPPPISSSKRNVQRPSNDIHLRIYSELLTI